MADSIPVYVFESEDRLTPEHAQHIVESWRLSIEGTALADARLLILDGGQRIRPLSPEAEQLPQAADVLEANAMPELAEWFRSLSVVNQRQKAPRRPRVVRRGPEPARGTPNRAAPKRAIPNQGR